MSRVLVWFSRGAASAVAAKVAVARFVDRPVEVCYCDTSADEHSDGERFHADVERWIGRGIKRLRHPTYRSVTEVWEHERYVAGVHGASCTRALKREVREAYQQPEDTHVFGFTADERGRVADFERFHPTLDCAWLLAGITKADCYRIVQAAGIALPAPYLLGFNNNNCLGCPKGGMGYWNKVRRHFPDVFAQRAATFRVLGVRLFKRADGSRFGLDDLPEDAGRDKEPDIECGAFCGRYESLLTHAIGGPP